MSETVREAVGVFDSAEDLENALDGLLSHGFDRAELSLLASEHAIEKKLGHRYATVEEVEDDPEVPRRALVRRAETGAAEGAVLGGFMYVGAVAAAGAVIAAGGPAGTAIVAAVLSGGAGALVGGGLARLIGRHHADHLQEQLDHGGLVLWVRTRDEAHEAAAREVLSAHNARHVHVHDVPDWAGDVD